MNIFNFFGSILGYLLWFLYTIFQNYGVAIIFFTIIVKIVMLPLTIKQQKSMAAQSKMAEKQKELQKRCGNDKQKYNDELTKLYEKENVNPMSGCLYSLIPLPIMFGIYYSVIYPLSNTLHIASDTISEATAYIQKLPGITSVSNYVELEIIKNWDSLKGTLTMFSASDIEKIEKFNSGFEFLGLNLLNTPRDVPFTDMLWVIPVLSLVASLSMTVFMNKNSGVKQQGSMKIMLYLLPLMSAYWAYIFPAAVGFYWVFSSLTGGAQSYVTNKFFSVNHMTALQDAQRFVTLEQKEEKIKELPQQLQKELAAKIEAQSNPLNGSQQKQNKNASNKKKAKQKSKGTNDYLGKKI